MSAKSKVSDTFERSTCFLCGYSGISQYFNINENFIEYLPTNYISYREILNETLQLKDVGLKLRTEEICLDCKDKAVKFYYFKRKVQDCKKLNKSPHDMKRIRDQKTNKAVLSINEVLEKHKDYSVAFIKVDEQNRKLNIELKLNKTIESQNNESDYEQGQEDDDFESIQDIPYDPTTIKHEDVFCDTISYTDVANEYNGMYDDDNDFNQSNPTTSKKSKPVVVKSKPKSVDVYPHRLTILPVDIEDTIALYDPNIKKFSSKYRNIIRRLLFDHYNIRVTIISSYVGTAKTNITLRCEQCKQGYKLYGYRRDLDAKIKTRFTVRSQINKFCTCCDEDSLLVEKKQKLRR